jgi:glycosyltransferase involved in cell wall biosynthesis
MTNVSVVICTHLEERWHQLLAALDSLTMQTLLPCEVIVVVDGDHGLHARLIDRRGPERVILLQARSGLSTGRNVGLSAASGTHIAFLDDDAVAEPTWLAQLIGGMTDDDVVGASGSSLPAWEGTAPRWFPPELLWTVGCSYAGMPTKTTVVRNVFGGCACIRRYAFEVVGGFDPALGRRNTGLAGGEEADFSMRLRRALPQAVFVHRPEARIHHFVPLARQRVSYVLRRCYAEGRSKALLRKRGTLAALSSERSYLSHTVPSALADYLKRAVRLDIGALARALVLTLGVASTLVGYVYGNVARTPGLPVVLPPPSAAVALPMGSTDGN